MALPLRKSFAPKRDQILTVVLGTRTTQAVWMQRQAGGLVLRDFCLQEAPVYESGLSRDLLAKHLKGIQLGLTAETDQLLLVIGMADSLLRQVELPPVEPSVMRRMLKIHSKNYFQQYIPDFAFDCHILGSKTETDPAQSKTQKKNDVLVGGAKAQFIEDLDAAAQLAGLNLVGVGLTQIALINAARLSMPEVIAADSVALLDIGFLTSTITLLVQGRFELTRVVGLGGDTLTSGLAQAMKITYPVAEGIKSVMPEKVQGLLQNLLTPLAEELRTAITFFESQHDKHISQVFVAGGTGRSTLILDILQKLLELPCRAWVPTAFYHTDLPQKRQDELLKDGTQLAAALGAAGGYFERDLIEINLLAEKIESEEMHRRDPVRRGAWISASVLVLLLIWAGVLWFQRAHAKHELEETEAKLTRMAAVSKAAFAQASAVAAVEQTLQSLNALETNRFIWSLPLNALQFAVVPQIQVVRLKMAQTLANTPATKATVKNDVPIPAKPAVYTERISLTIQAKDSGNPPAVENFIQRLGSEEYFHDQLRKTEPVRLIERLPPQIDPSDPSRTFTLFTIECLYPERKL